MPYRWECAPVTIRLSLRDEIYGLSGVHLVLLNSDTGEVGFDNVITFSNIDIVQKDEIRASVSASRSSDIREDCTVSWYPARIEITYQLPHIVSDQITYFRQNGFNLVPQDTERTKSLSILKLAFINRQVKELFYKSNKYSPVKFPQNPPPIGHPIQITSSPFSFTNTLLFSNFRSEGIINYILGDTANPAAYLSDIKYLDNMIGGLANYSETESTGLVLGSLRKANGDGDLTVIIPWALIWKEILPKSLDNQHEIEKALQPNKLFCHSLNFFEEPSSIITPSNVTFPLQVKERFSNSWGSCVYYNANTIVTNYHVLKPYLKNPTLIVEIHLAKGNRIILDRLHDRIITPAESLLDISFICLSESNIQRLKEVSLVPANHGTSYDVGDKVYSVGYGLFFNSNDICPITSTGIINTTLSMPAKLQDSVSYKSMIVTSSSCWNGSSGGGVFDKSNNLIGLICSNAQVFIPNVGALQSSNPKTEKLPKVAFVIPIELIQYCYDMSINSTGFDLNPQIGDLWQLKNIQQDIQIESSKL